MCKYYLKEPDAVKEKAPEPKPKRGELFSSQFFLHSSFPLELQLKGFGR